MRHPNDHRVRGAVLAVFALVASTLYGGQSAPRISVRSISFATADGGTIKGDLYGWGPHAVVLAHGAAFDRKSWATLAARLAKNDLRVLAIDFRGYGDSSAGSKGPRAFDEDILGAIHALHDAGATSVSVVGASMGGGAAATAATRAKPGAIDRLVLLSPVPIQHPESMRAGSITYIASADEPLYPRIRAQYDRVPEPKSIHVIEGSAHAQHILETGHAEALMRLIAEALVSGKK